MDTSPHTLHSLFDQLGLPSWEEAIARFVDDHGPLDAQIELADAGFWSDSQRAFLKESILQDSDWAEVVDQLDALLRES